MKNVREKRIKEENGKNNKKYQQNRSCRNEVPMKSRRRNKNG